MEGRRQCGVLDPAHGPDTLLMRGRFFWQVLGLIALALVSRVSSLPGTYIFDDVPVVLEDPRVAQTQWGAIFTQPYWNKEGYGLFRPLTSFTYALERALLGPQAWHFHVVNLLLHALNVVLLFSLLMRLARVCRGVNDVPGDTHSGNIPGGAPLWPFFLSAFVAVHPTLIEAVSAIVGRAELMVASFGLLMAHQLLSWNQHPRVAPWVIGLLWGASLLSKEHAVVLPLALGLVLIWQLGTGRASSTAQVQSMAILPHVLPELWAKRWMGLSLSLALGCVILWRSQVLDAPTPLAQATQVSGLSQHLWVTFQVLGLSLRWLIWPVFPKWDFTPFQLLPATGPMDPHVVLGLLSLGGILAVSLTSKRRWAYAGLSLFLALLTQYQWIPIGILFAHRTLYWPCFALALGVGLAFARDLTDQRRSWLAAATPSLTDSRPGLRHLSIVLASLILAGLMTVTLWESRHWRHDLTYWQITQARSPQSMSANMNLGMAYRRANDFRQAEHYLRQAIALAPNTSNVYLQLGHVLMDQGKWTEATQALTSMTRIFPNNATAFDLLGLSYVMLGDFDRAHAAMTRALALAPHHVKYRQNYIGLLTVTKNDEARTAACQAFRQDFPAHPELAACKGP